MSVCGAFAIADGRTDAFDIGLIEKGTDVFYLPAQLGDDLHTELLFDTGSGYLAINENTLKTLRKAGAARYQRSINARLAHGKVKKVDIYTISSLRLGQQCTLHQVEAAILPGATRNILGMNVLKMVQGFSVSFQPAQLTITGCAGPGPVVALSL